DPPRDQLEWPGGDLSARGSDPDNDALAPSAMAALQRLAHDLSVADAFEAVVGTPSGELDQVRHEFALQLARIDEVRDAELAGQGLACWIQVHAYDPVGSDHPRALHHIQADASESEHDHVGPRFDARGEQHGP